MNSFELRMRELAKEELKRLPGLMFRNRVEVETQLRENFGRRLYWIGKDDERRLLTLSIWADKYHVTVGWILGILIPYYQERFKQRRKSDRKGLPVRITTLCGKHAEYLIKQRLEKDFPNQENIELYRQQQRQIILLERDERLNGVDEFQQRTRKLTDFEWPSRYVRYYRTKMEAQRKVLVAATTSKKNRKPYRGNPFL